MITQEVPVYFLEPEDFEIFREQLQLDIYFAAFTVWFLDEEPCIVIDSGEWNELEPDMRQILVTHELAHAYEIHDEEEADYWALDHLLSDEQRTILKNMWYDRHGRTFKQFQEESGHIT